MYKISQIFQKNRYKYNVKFLKFWRINVSIMATLSYLGYPVFPLADQISKKPCLASLWSLIEGCICC